MCCLRITPEAAGRIPVPDISQITGTAMTMQPGGACAAASAPQHRPGVTQEFKKRRIASEAIPERDEV